MPKIKILINIVKEFIIGYPKYSFILFVSLLLETIIVSSAVLALIPFADFMMD